MVKNGRDGGLFHAVTRRVDRVCPLIGRDIGLSTLADSLPSLLGWNASDRVEKD